MTARSIAESRRNLRERCRAASMSASTCGRRGAPSSTSAQSKGRLQYETHGLLGLQSRLRIITSPARWRSTIARRPMQRSCAGVDNADIRMWMS